MVIRGYFTAVSNSLCLDFWNFATGPVIGSSILACGLAPERRELACSKGAPCNHYSPRRRAPSPETWGRGTGAGGIHWVIITRHVEGPPARDVGAWYGCRSLLLSCFTFFQAGGVSQRRDEDERATGQGLCTKCVSLPRFVIG